MSNNLIPDLYDYNKIGFLYHGANTGVYTPYYKMESVDISQEYSKLLRPRCTIRCPYRKLKICISKVKRACKRWLFVFISNVIP